MGNNSTQGLGVLLFLLAFSLIGVGLFTGSTVLMFLLGAVCLGISFFVLSKAKPSMMAAAIDVPRRSPIRIAMICSASCYLAKSNINYARKLTTCATWPDAADANLHGSGNQRPVWLSQPARSKRQMALG